MRCKIHLDYYIFKTKLPDEEYQKLRSVVHDLPLEQPIIDFYHPTHSANIVELAKSGFAFTVSGGVDEMTFAATVIENLQLIIKNLSGSPMPTSTIKPTSVVIEQSQDAFLHRIDKVMIAEDLCTDELQRYLNSDWRIVAVCYQKGSRRPDYVLGRKEVKIEETIEQLKDEA